METSHHRPRRVRWRGQEQSGQSVGRRTPGRQVTASARWHILVGILREAQRRRVLRWGFGLPERREDRSQKNPIVQHESPDHRSYARCGAVSVRPGRPRGAAASRRRYVRVDSEPGPEGFPGVLRIAGSWFVLPGHQPCAPHGFGRVHDISASRCREAAAPGWPRSSAEVGSPRR